MKYAVLQDGKVRLLKTLFDVGEGETGPVASAGRFQIADEGRLIIAYYASGHGISENRVCEIKPGGEVSAPVRVPLKQPFSTFFTATVRAGSPPSRHLEMLGQAAGDAHTIRYARVRLW